MSQTTSRIHSRLPILGTLSRWFFTGLTRGIGMLTNSYSLKSSFAQKQLQSLRQKLDANETVLLLGLTPGGHNTGCALVEVSHERGIRLLSNHEEERYRGEKLCHRFPSESLLVLNRQLADMGKSFDDIHAVLLGWDYCKWAGTAAEALFSELPGSYRLTIREASPNMHADAIYRALGAPGKIQRTLNLSYRVPVIHMRHHDNHAWFSYLASPFANKPDPVMVLVVDGAGDDGAISWYLGQNGKLELQFKNNSVWDSLGQMYGSLSSALGGWPLGQSEGRFMGAAAWGKMDRHTNPYYARLRDVFHFSNDGTVYHNRAFGSWHQGAALKPFGKRMKELLGEPLLPKDMWNPDAVLKVEDIEHAPITQDRVDKAAAVQMVFEDALFHIVGHMIKTTGASKLVITGGTALNCVANMRVADGFDKEWYKRYLGQENTRLHLWVPPIPNDEGIAPGAAYQFAAMAGAPIDKPETRMRHAFYCGLPPTKEEIGTALEAADDMATEALGNVEDIETRNHIADFMAYVISKDGVLGIYQGAGETGPRALGHRSFLANPTNRDTLKTLNSLVKFREIIRPLAPMATLEAAKKFFELCPGADEDDYNAYNYMILTARAKPLAREIVPAVVHFDGTCRVQVVREEIDPVCYAFLKAMGRRVGAEVSVNTSLNVGSPICQTPEQAIETVRRSSGMHGLVMIDSGGDASLVWHNVKTEHKDAGEQLLKWKREHAEENDLVPDRSEN